MSSPHRHLQAMAQAQSLFLRERPFDAVLGCLFAPLLPACSISVVEVVPSEHGEAEWVSLGEWVGGTPVVRRPEERVRVPEAVTGPCLRGERVRLLGREVGEDDVQVVRGFPLMVDGEVLGVAVISGPLGTDEEGSLSWLVSSAASWLDARRADASRRAAHRRLAQAEATARAMVQRAPDAVMMMGPDGRVEDLNPAAERLFGAGLMSVLGTAAEQVMGVATCPTSWTCGRHDVVGTTPSGEPLPMDATVHDVPDGSRKVRVLTVRDQRARRRTADELQALNQELRGRVAELGRLNRENELLGQLGGFLQACHDVRDVHSVLRRFLPNLIEGASGAYFQHTGTLLSQEVGWGAAEGNGVFTADACWALRRGEVHVAHGQDDLVCGHRHDNMAGLSVCVPVMTSDGPAGLVHVVVPEPVAGDGESERRVLTAVADRLGAALANLRLRERLQQESIRDPLTGLFNRRYMVETLHRELARARRAEEALAVIMADVDHFKRLNDSFGHDTGDEALRVVAAALQAGVRSEDVVCRYGGEEFVIILPGATLPMAAQRARELCARLRTTPVPARDGQVPKVTMSAGVAATQGEVGPEALLRAADRALLHAKQTGRDRACVAGEEAADPRLQAVPSLHAG